MRRLITICAVGALLFVLASSATAAMISVDPDAFPAGTVLNNAYPGVTLTALGDPGVLPNNDVIAYASAVASTGSNVFGDNEPGLNGLWGDGNWDYLRVDFAPLEAVMVSLDFITDDSGGDHNAVLKAYDSGGVLVDSDGPYFVTAPIGNFLTLTVSAPNIAWIEADWDNIGRFENGALDNLQFTPVPIPGAILLGILGLSVAGLKLRKFA